MHEMTIFVTGAMKKLYPKKKTGMILLQCLKFAVPQCKFDAMCSNFFLGHMAT